MSEQYSHRNDETEPPTEDGWYWFDGFCEDVYMQDLIDLSQERRDIVWRGKWWGPIVPPWEDNA